VKTEERRQARALRQCGGSVKEIAGAVGVAQSTVSRWVRDIELTAGQRLALRARDPRFAAHLNGSRAISAKALERRIQHQQEGRGLVRSDDDFAVLCALYWAEGEKTRNALRLSNSDPDLIALFLNLLRRTFGITDDAVRISCNLFADHEQHRQAIENFWLQHLQLPRSSFLKSTVNRYSKYSVKKRRNALPHGTCRLVVNSTRLVQTVYGGIQELGRFERPEWAA
jgi:transposase-like protein